MTAVQAEQIVCLGTVYAAPIRDPEDGRIHLDYVGKTKRSLAAREAEHRGLGRNPEDEQPWSDLIDGQFVVLEQGLWTSVKLGEREQWWIRNLQPHRPRYNWEFNTDLISQIPIPRAADQRAARDRARGVMSRWTNPELFERPAPHSVDPTAVVVPRFSFWRWLATTSVARRAARRTRNAARAAAPWLAVYAVLAAAGWWWTSLGLEDAAGAAVAGTGAVYAGWRRLTRPKRPTRRTNRRRTR